MSDTETPLMKKDTVWSVGITNTIFQKSVLIYIRMPAICFKRVETWDWWSPHCCIISSFKDTWHVCQPSIALIIILKVECVRCLGWCRISVDQLFGSLCRIFVSYCTKPLCNKFVYQSRCCALRLWTLEPLQSYILKKWKRLVIIDGDDQK